MEVKAKKITHENFGKFGTFLDPYNCGTPIVEGDITYYPDRLPLNFASSTLITVSVVVMKKRAFVEQNMEYHERTEEVQGGYNADTVFFVGPPRKEPELSKFEAFILPKNNWYRTKRGVWHWAPFPIEEDNVLGWCLLPPYTYTNDSISTRASDPIKIIL